MRLSRKKLKYIRRHAAGKSPEQIAKALGVPVEAVKKALRGSGGGSKGAPPAGAGMMDGRANARGLAPLAATVLERGPFWGVFALAVAAPFVMVPGLRDYSNLPKSAFVQLGALAVALLWLVARGLQKDCRLVRTPIDLPLLAFLGWAFVSLIWSHNRYEALLVWSRWAACGLVFVLTVNAIRDARDIRRLLWGFFASGLAVALVGVLQYLLKLGWIPQAIPPAATFGNKNFAAQYIVLTLPVGAGLFLTARTRAREWLLAFGCALMCVFLCYTVAKAAWVALASQIALLVGVLLWYGLKRRAQAGPPPAGTTPAVRAPPWVDRPRSKAAALLSSAALAFVLVNLTPEGFRWGLGSVYEDASALWHKPEGTGTDANETGISRVEAQYRSSVQYRLMLWGNTLAMVGDHPLRGVGIGNWRVLYVRYSSSFALDEGVTSRRQPGRAHNDHVQILAELGLVGMALYLWLGYAVVSAFTKALARGTGRETRCVLMAVAAGVLGILVDASFSLPFQLPVPPLVLMTYLGILGVTIARGEEGARAPRTVRLPAWAPVPAAVAVAVVLLVHGRTQYCRMVADWHFRQMDIASKKKDWLRVIDEGNKAYRYNPHRKKTLVTVAGGYIVTASAERSGQARLRRFKRAAAILEEALEAYPDNLKAYDLLGVAYLSMRDFERALACYKSALEIRPAYAAGHHKMAAVYLQQKRPEEAARSLSRALRYDPENPVFLKNMGNVRAEAKEFGKALVYYKRAVEAKPDDASLHKAIAGIHMKRGRAAEAMRAYRLALKYDPTDASSHHDLGVAAFRVGRHRESKAAFEKALAIRPLWPLAHKNLGMLLLESLGETAEGIRHLKRALELDPELAGAEQVRAHIRAGARRREVPRR